MKYCGQVKEMRNAYKILFGTVGRCEVEDLGVVGGMILKCRLDRHGVVHRLAQDWLRRRIL